MRAILVALLALSAPALAEDTPLHPGDFAYGMTLQGEASGAFYGLELPEEVYTHVTRADLGDLRVFNAEGEVVPHQLQQATLAAEQRQRSPLPFYPLYAETGQRSGETTLRIVPDAKGTLIDLRANSGAEQGKRISHYLLDASTLEAPLRRLKLQWHAGSETFITQITVEASDDLSHWHSVGSASLADLLYEGYRLQRNEIQLSPVRDKYLRISWPMGSKQVVLTSVEAEVVQPGSEQPLHWSSATALAGDGTVGRYRFDAGGYYPVEKIEVLLPQVNSVVRARISSSGDEAARQWRNHYQGVVYSLQQEGQSLSSGAIATARSSHRYWRVDIDQQNGGLGSGEPQLKLGWRPQRLLFVARGSAPFTLAFGSATVQVLSPDNTLQGVVDALQQGRDSGSLVKPVSAQALHILGGEARLQPPPPPLPWKKWLLWAVLLLGVAGMLLMARSLYRQMNGGKSAA